MPQTILDMAIKAAQAGCSLLPVRPYSPQTGDKVPALSWKKLQKNPLTPEQIRHFFTDGNYGIGIIMGEASNNLMMIELEGRAAHYLPELTTLAFNSGLEDLWKRMCGWWETSPTGGHHWYIYCPENSHGNRKLACRPATPEELKEKPSEKEKTLAETRENGGYSVVAPLDGKRFHHTGKGAWSLISGGPETAGHFTLEELDTLLDIFRSINQNIKPAPQPPLETSHPQHDNNNSGVMPGDDYENKTDWVDILTPHGWARLHTDQSGTTYWRRPGKNTGISATTGNAKDRDRLYVFSTSTIFEPETAYTKFATYTILNHGGDYREAAKQLAKQGYGTPPTRHVNADPLGLNAWIQKQQTTTQENTNKEPPTNITLTDDGNTILFTHLHGNKYTYIPEQGTWATWNGHVWDTTNRETQIITDIRKMVRALPQDTKEATNHRKKSLSKNSIFNIERLTRTELTRPLNQFDNNPWTLNTPKGTVNLKTGKLTNPNPANYQLKTTSVAPDPTMPTPKWTRFLAETFAGTPELTQYVQRIIGLALIGKVLQQEFYFFHGAGANGKSVLLNVIRNILGTGPTGYATTLQPATFTQGADRRHPADIATLQGTRLAFTSETEQSDKFSESRIKMLTGADNITARYMNRDFFEFTPSHTLIMVSNFEPEVLTGGNAFWRRVKKIPFNHIVPEHARNTNLENELLEEAPGILAWALAGTQDYLQHGMEEPLEVVAATRKYELEQDTVRLYVEECCALAEHTQAGYVVTVVKLRNEYETWCRRNSYEPVSAKALTQRLKSLGVATTRSSQARAYLGIKISTEQGQQIDDYL